MTRHGFLEAGSASGAPARSLVERFTRAYRRARQIWGDDAEAVSAEVVAALAPDLPVFPTTGQEHESVRRMELAVAARLNSEGIPAPYPAASLLPPSGRASSGPPWHRALTEGFLK
jgi:hypothetical protein